nr:tRNA (N6-isopentenyl adenosine(37)-C2)-methylthiotransferase MiaB [Gammaproteobacteria bacterium]
KRTLVLEEADLLVLNTCAIRKNAEDKVFGELGRLKKLKRQKPEIITVLCGCMAQEQDAVNRITRNYQNVDIVLGTHNIHSLPSLISKCLDKKERLVDVLSYEGDIVENVPLRRESKIKAWVPIMYGCDEFCTYCIVPYTRGKERSRLPENILKEVDDLISEGYKEITLLGQNVNAYGQDFVDRKYDFADLLTDLHKKSIDRIRFTTSNPKDFDDKQVKAMALGGNIMPQLHLPVQSGSNEVLKRMARRYTREKYLDLVKKIKEAIPNISLTTDIIVAFPGETEEQFNETLTLVKECEFEGAFTFIFSPREGTPAAKLDIGISDAEAHERLYKLNELVNIGYAKGTKRFLNTIQKVLIEGFSKNDPDMLMGYNENGKLVNVKGDKENIGKIVNVKITDAKTWSLDGEICE